MSIYLFSEEIDNLLNTENKLKDEIKFFWILK